MRKLLAIAFVATMGMLSPSLAAEECYTIQQATSVVEAQGLITAKVTDPQKNEALLRAIEQVTGRNPLTSAQMIDLGTVLWIAPVNVATQQSDGPLRFGFFDRNGCDILGGAFGPLPFLALFEAYQGFLKEGEALGGA